MDLSFSKEEVAFRDEVRAFFRDHVPPTTRQKLRKAAISPSRRWSTGGGS